MDYLEKKICEGRQERSVCLPWCDRCIPTFKENLRGRGGMDWLIQEQLSLFSRSCRGVAGGKAASQQDGSGRMQRCKG